MSPQQPSRRFPALTLCVLSALLVGGHGALGNRVDVGTNIVVCLSHLFVLWLGGHYWRALTATRFGAFVATVMGMFFLLIAFKGQPLFYAAFLPLAAASLSRPFLFGVVVLLVLCLALITPYWCQAFSLVLLAYLAGAQLAQARAGKTAWLLFLLGIPMLWFLAFPVITAIFEVEPQTLWERFTRPRMLRALWTSLWTASTATAAATLLGVPLAYVLARVSFKGRALVDSLIDLPILIPQTVAGVALMSCLGPKAALGVWVEQATGIRFTGTAWGIVIAQLFVAAPFVIRSSAVGFAGVDVRLERAARSLGASSWGVLTRISLPLALPAIVAGGLMTWARAISEFGALMILAYRPMSVPVLVYDDLTQYGLNEAKPASALLLILCLWIFFVARWLAWLRGKQGSGVFGSTRWAGAVLGRES